MSDTHSDDDSGPGSADERPPLEDNVKSRSTWLRLLFLFVFGALYMVTRIVVLAVVVLQFFWLLFSGDVNPRLSAAGQSLATYTYQLVRYLTFASDVRPFPVDEDWPSTDPL